MSVGHSIIMIKQAQQSCAALLLVSEQGLLEILNLKYLAMEEANRSEQNITAQKYIDQMNLDSVKKSIMRNYVNTFPQSYSHLNEFTDWEELEQYVNKFAKEEK